MKRLRTTVLASTLLAVVTAIAIACSDEPRPADDVDASVPGDLPDASTDADAAVPPVPRGGRTVGLAVDIATLDFVRDVELARDAGLQTTNVTFGWDEIDRPIATATDAGDEDAGDEDAGGEDAGVRYVLSQPALHIANLVLPSTSTQALVAIDAIDGSGLRLPGDLRGRALDDPEIAARYERLTDYVFAQLYETKVTALVVARSVDVTLRDPARASAFETFFARVAAHARQVRPGLVVGFTVSGDALLEAPPFTTAAWGAADFVGIDFLPVSASGVVRSVEAAAGEIDRIVAAVPGDKPIVVREIGYPTSGLVGSDEAAQAAFIAATFQAWDRHATRISTLVFRELDDAPAAAVAPIAARYGRSDAPFLATLQSLGLRAGDGRAKPGFDAFFRQTRARGW
ncbi:MAG: hypothetical protein KF819_38625 [Labilithrix sp.]|nr:hypothetical protein [Labilithrix sp.]